MRILKVWDWVAVAALAALIQGCAVQKGANGNMVVRVDQAELLGRKIDTFTLPGGGTGALRIVGNEYSLKFDKYFRVVPIGQANAARVVKVEQVGDRDTVLVVKSDDSCGYRYQLFSIKGSDVLSWDLYSDCKTQAVLLKVDNEQQFEFQGPYQVTRYVYRGSQLFRSDIPLNRTQQASPASAPDGGSGPRYAPGAPPAATVQSPPPDPVKAPAGVEGPRYVPGAPSAGTAKSAPPDPVKRTATAPRTTPATRPVQAAAPQPAKLQFPAEEQKAIRIVLDK